MYSDRDELGSNVAGGQWPAGDPAWEQPAVGAAGVGRVAAGVDLLADEAGERFGHFDRDGVEGDGGSPGDVADLVGAHVADPGQALGE